MINREWEIKTAASRELGFRGNNKIPTRHGHIVWPEALQVAVRRRGPAKGNPLTIEASLGPCWQGEPQQGNKQYHSHWNELLYGIGAGTAAVSLVEVASVNAASSGTARAACL